jgi:hypothetical protein
VGCECMRLHVCVHGSVCEFVCVCVHVNACV